MADYKVSYRYAVSLLESAEEKNNLDNVAVDIVLLIDTLEGNKKLQLVLESPVIKPDVKSKIFHEIFDDKFNSETLEFIDFVIKKKRENLLYSIARRFLALRDEKLGIANAEVNTAFELSDDQKNSLKEKLENILNKKVRLAFSTDKNLIGGFVAKVDDTVYDASIRQQLKLLKKQFLHGGLSLN